MAWRTTDRDKSTRPMTSVGLNEYTVIRKNKKELNIHFNLYKANPERIDLNKPSVYVNLILLAKPNRSKHFPRGVHISLPRGQRNVNPSSCLFSKGETLAKQIILRSQKKEAAPIILAKKSVA